MKLLAIVALITAGLLSGCLTTTKRGEYSVDVHVAEQGRAEVSGYFHASPFVSWKETRYGDEPKVLVQLLIGSFLSDVPPASYRVSEVRFTRYEPGGNYVGWSAVVTGSEEIIGRLKPKVGKRIEGDFSFEESRLLQVLSERAYP